MTVQYLKSLALALAVLAPAAADAQQQQTRLRDIVVEAPWSQVGMSPSSSGGVYFSIRNNGPAPIVLQGVSSTAAPASLHDVRASSPGKAMMTGAGPIRIPAGGAVSLSPDGLHVMLADATQLREGDGFALTLSFDNGGEITVPVPVMGATATGPSR